MGVGKLTCIHCEEVIVVYYHYGYKGTRGRCPKCDAEFPLE